MNRRWLAGSLAGAAVVALGVWIGLNLEAVERELDLGYRGEAARNPYLAAGRFLRRMGVEAAVLPAHRWLDRPPGGPAVLWLATGREGLMGRRLEGLLEWVAAGNRLMVRAAPAGEEGEEDPLLERLEISARHVAGIPRRTAVELFYPHRDLSLEFATEVRLAGDRPGIQAYAGDDQGALILEVPHGSGRVTVFAAMGPFTNRHLGERDHAEVLMRLVGAGGLPVWLVVDEGGPSLLARVWQHLPALPLGLGMVLALVLWRRIPRLGPAADLPAAARRSLLEHVTAAGWYHWRRSGQGRLLAAVRRALDQKAAVRHPGYRELTEAERVRVLSRLSGRPADEVQAALAEPEHPRPDAFVAAVAQLETIRKRI